MGSTIRDNHIFSVRRECCTCDRCTVEHIGYRKVAATILAQRHCTLLLAIEAHRKGVVPLCVGEVFYYKLICRGQKSYLPCRLSLTIDKKAIIGNTRDIHLNLCILLGLHSKREQMQRITLARIRQSTTLKRCTAIEQTKRKRSIQHTLYIVRSRIYINRVDHIRRAHRIRACVDKALYINRVGHCHCNST